MSQYEKLKSTRMNLKHDRYSVAANFDATLYKSRTNVMDYKLTLRLWIELKQINPNPYPWLLDADKKPFWIRPWGSIEWFQFVKGAEAQANMWNNQFWLKPPSSVTEYDEFNGVWWRPYIKCELETIFGTPLPDERHRTIEAANIDMNKYLNPNPTTFRSHALLYCSLDNTPSVYSVPDGAGKVTNLTQPTIAHEIGHALGLHHIGVIRKTIFCQVAEAYGFEGTPFEGGTNAAYCYGWDQAPDISANIMGYGQQFTADNASPWVWSALTLFGQYGVWQVLTRNPGNKFAAPDRKAR